MTLTKPWTMALQDDRDAPWPVLSAEEETAAMVAGVHVGLADVEAGRTTLLEDYKAEVQARRRLRDAHVASVEGAV